MPILMSLHGHRDHPDGEIVKLIPGLENVTSRTVSGPVNVVLTEAGAVIVVPSSRCVRL